MRVEQATKLVGLSSGGGVLEGLDGTPHLVVALVALLILAHEQLEPGVPESLGDLVDGPAGRVGCAGVEAAIEGAADVVEIARVRGGEDAFAVALVERCLESPPAREAVLAGDHQLGIGEPGGGILSAHLLQALRGVVPEMLEIGAERKRP